MKNTEEFSLELESGVIRSRRCILAVYIALYTMPFLFLALVIVREPWPLIADKEALVKECGEWLRACERIQRWDEKPPMPPRIAGISSAWSKSGCTHVEDDHVDIFVGEKEAFFFEGYTTYFYIVFPLELDNPDYQPCPSFPCKPTWHPRIFKRKRTYEFDNATSGYVEVTD